MVGEYGSPRGERAGPENRAGRMHRRRCRLADANQVKWPSTALRSPAPSLVRLGQGGQGGMAVTLVFFYGSAALFVHGVGRARPSMTSRQRSLEEGRRLRAAREPCPKQPKPVGRWRASTKASCGAPTTPSHL